MTGITQAPGRSRAASTWLAALLLLGLVMALPLGRPAMAEGGYPALTGRVVDDAGVLRPAARGEIAETLAALQRRSQIQVIVATLPSLGGRDIESTANGLFRAWKLGDAKRNDGVLLLVAPTERKVRIEVGYGLEGTLTDAMSQVIITTIIVPAFKTGNFEGGIRQGVAGIVTVLTGEVPALPALPPPPAAPPSYDIVIGFWPFMLCVTLVLALCIQAIRTARRPAKASKRRASGRDAWRSAGSSSSSSDGSSSDSGTSGGGGSSGGGGASGSW